MTDMAQHMQHDQEGALVVGGAVPVPDLTATPKRLGFAFWLCVGWMAVIALVAILAPWLPLKDPNESFVIPGERPPYAPSTEFWFGTDQLSRDMFSRTVWGARISLVIGIGAILFGFLVGGTMGIIAGYFKGVGDRIVSFIFLILLSFPALVLAILITSLLDRNLITITFTFTILAIAPVGLVARATTVSFADREFVLAARTLGAKHPRIMIRELLPNAVIPMGAFALLGVAIAIVGEGALAFLGLSVRDGITWGKLIQNGASPGDIESTPWIAFAPILILFLTVLALNFAGDRLRNHFDVKESSL